MAYKRDPHPALLPTGDELIPSLVGLGMRFAVSPSRHAQIEDALMGGSVVGMEEDDRRVLAVLVTWLGIHQARVNVDRLVRSTPGLPDRTRAFWGAVARWLAKDRRWERLAVLDSGPRVDLITVGSDFMIRRDGEDDRFRSTRLRVPKGVLRERTTDVSPPSEVARMHRAYRHRILQGPVYRADMWAELEADPSLTAAELARRTHGSFATAWQVKRDFAVLAA